MPGKVNQVNQVNHVNQWIRREIQIAGQGESSESGQSGESGGKYRLKCQGESCESCESGESVNQEGNIDWNTGVGESSESGESVNQEGNIDWNAGENLVMAPIHLAGWQAPQEISIHKSALIHQFTRFTRITDSLLGARTFESTHPSPTPPPR